MFLQLLGKIQSRDWLTSLNDMSAPSSHCFPEQTAAHMPLLTCPAQPGSLLSIRQMRTVEETILFRPHQAQSPLWSDLAFPFFPLSLTLPMPSISKSYSSTAPFLEKSQNINPTLTLNPRVAKKISVITECNGYRADTVLRHLAGQGFHPVWHLSSK